jgi:hypothetical protein
MHDSLCLLFKRHLCVISVVLVPPEPASHRLYHSSVPLPARPGLERTQPIVGGERIHDEIEHCQWRLWGWALGPPRLCAVIADVLITGDQAAEMSVHQARELNFFPHRSGQLGADVCQLGVDQRKVREGLGKGGLRRQGGFRCSTRLAARVLLQALGW